MNNHVLIFSKLYITAQDRESDL